MRRLISPKLTLTPEIDPAVTLFDTREVEFTKYGISYAPDTELAQDKVNRSFGPWHDLENKAIYHEPKVADTWNFRRTLQKIKLEQL